MRTSIILATVIVATAALTARAELKKGDQPKLMGASAHYINCDEFDLVKMRGKVVILQLAHTKSDPSKEQVTRLKDLDKRFAEKGLRIVVAFEEPSDAVQSFVDANSIKYPVVANVGDLRTRWGVVGGFPTSYILDVQGKVAWAGNFADQAEVKIETLLKKVTDRPWLPTKYAAIDASLDSESFGDARMALVEALAAEKVIDDDRTRLTAVVAWLDKRADAAFAATDARRFEGTYVEIYKAYLEVVNVHAGSAAAEKAQAAVDTMLASKSVKRELDAWEFFDTQLEAAKAIELKDRKKAILLLKKVTSRFRGTEASTKAKGLVARLSK